MATQTPTRTRPETKPGEKPWYLPKELCPQQAEEVCTEIKKALA